MLEMRMITTRRDRLTARQEQVLEAVRRYQDENGFPPTVRELADQFGHASTAGIYKILKLLQEKGYLTQRERGKSRAMGIPERDTRVRPVPIVGQVEAGAPTLAVEEKEGDFYLDSDWAPGGESFLLRVQGYSMVDADIKPGDLLIVEPGTTCHNGEIIIALLEDEATVKRLFWEKDKIRLQPENQAMQPIYIPRDDPSFRLIGKVRGLLRRF
jgi:repressor LexA